MSRRVKVACLVGLAVAAGIACRMGLSQSSRRQTEQEAEALFATALPHLEKALGYRLPAKPVFKAVTFKDCKKMPAWETHAWLKFRFPALTGQAKEKSYQVAHHLLCQATVARHVEGTASILLVPENLPAIAAWDKSLAAVNTNAFLQLALVHEAARLALEKKHRLLDPVHDPHTLEEYRINQAIRAGRAQWLTWQVAEKLGTEKLVPLLAEIWRHVPGVASDPQVRTVYQTMLQQKYWATVKGLAFFDALHSRRFADAEATVFQRPPRQVEWIEQPELYLQRGLGDDVDFRFVFAAIQENHSPPGWQPMQQPWTPNMLIQVASMLNQTKPAEKISQEWQQGRSLIWTNPQTPGDYISLSAVRFQSTKAAQSYFGFATDLQRKRDEMAGQSFVSPFEITNSQFHSMDWSGFDDVVRNEKSMLTPGQGGSRPMTVLLARSGPLVLEINWHGTRSNIRWAQRICQTLLKESSAE